MVCLLVFIFNRPDCTFLSWMFLIVSFSLAILTRKIIYKNFMDTNKSIIFLLVFMMINWSVVIPTLIILLNTTNLPINYQAINAVEIVSALTPATACQLILFTTKLLPVVREKLFPEAQTTSVTNVALPTAAAITTENS